jgi:S-adenosylmethionine hydrolase
VRTAHRFFVTLALVPPILTLLTDFGLADYYVAAVKGTVLRLAPGTQLVDLSHEVPPGDVEGAADLLAAALPTFPPGTVHLAVVDPGVGSARRMLVVETGGQLLVAPDNGLATPLLTPGVACWSVTRRDLFLDGPHAPGGSATFHGRDRFAPVAAALLRGEPPSSFAERIDDPVRLDLPEPKRERLEGGGWRLAGRVVRIDRFGNLVTDIPAAWLREAGVGSGVSARVLVDEHEAARWVTHYAELPAGVPGALIGSLGTLELSLRDESLATRWNTRRGARMRVEIG